MENQLHSPIGLIAGSGTFPLEFARNARARGLAVVVVAHRGETNAEIENLADECTWIRVGQFGKLLSVLRRAKVRQVAFAGGISRVRLFSGVRLDWKGATLLARLRSVQDDAVLRAVAQEIESSGIEVISAACLLEKSIPTPGALTKRQLSASECQDAKVGWEAAVRIGELDIGQTVVVTQRVVTAVEAVEGTDAAIARAGILAGPGGVVVKVCKPQQDQRIDLPTIGPQTIRSMHQAKATALVIQAGKTILLDPLEVVSLANEYQIAIQACVSIEAIF